MTDTDMNNLSLYLEKNYGLTSDRVIAKAIDIVANDNSFHPIIDLLESLKWDGRPRISGMLTHFFGAENPEYAGEVMKIHMLAAISRLYEPGKKYDIMLCLVGGQGTGKSTFFKYLAIQDEWFTDDVKRLDDKKVYEYLQGHWIVEMSEMNAVANAKSIEETKSFLSRQKDTYRIPYERRAEDRYRQCVFCGTSNDLAFLPFDRTGNRRFGPVKVCPEKAETTIYRDEKGSREYIIQAWAEAMEIYRSGKFLLTFSPDMEDYVKFLQKDFMPEDTQTGMIQAEQVELPRLEKDLKDITGFFKGKEKKEAQNKIDQCKERIRKQKDELHILVKKSGYPNVQKFMDGYRTAYKIVEQYKKELEIWKQKTGQNDIQPERKKSVLERLKENEKRVKERGRPKSVNKQKRHDWLDR